MESNGIRSDAMPRMLKRPRNVVDLAAGRQVVLAKDHGGQVWQWCRENKPVEVSFAGLPTGPGSSPGLRDTEEDKEELQEEEDPIDQISAGWDICATLTRSGRIFAWRPPQSADGRYQHRIHIEHWVSLREQGRLGFEAATMDSDRFVKIAAGTDYVVAVTSMGKVYIFRRLDSPHYHEPEEAVRRHPGRPRYTQVLDAHTPVDRIVIETIVEGSPMQERVIEIRGQILGHGLYLPIFSEALARTVTKSYDENEELERIKRHHRQRNSSSFGDHTNYTTPKDTPMSDFIDINNNNTKPLNTSSCPTTISANFQNFALHHHSGKVLLGRENVQSKSCPIVMERLLSNACQVEFGDHHQGLLTEDGQLRTWGAFADGALGHGDLRTDCAIPTVVEGALKNKFVIKLAMAGWQSACLAIDLSDDKVTTSHPLDIHHHHRHRLFAGLLGKRKEDEGDMDQSPGHDSGNGGSGNSANGGSSSEGVDSSDGEDWNGERNVSEMPPLSGPSYVGISSSSLLSSSSSFSMVPHYASRPGPSLPMAPLTPSMPPQMYPSCTVSCSLLVSPHSHHHGSSAGHVRTPLRKRSLSMVEREMKLEYVDRYKRAPVLALTRLNPTLSVYDPAQGQGQGQGQGHGHGRDVRHLADQFSALGH